MNVLRSDVLIDICESEMYLCSWGEFWWIDVFGCDWIEVWMGLILNDFPSVLPTVSPRENSEREASENQAIEKQRLSEKFILHRYVQRENHESSAKSNIEKIGQKW